MLSPSTGDTEGAQAEGTTSKDATLLAFVFALSWIASVHMAGDSKGEA